MTLSTRKLGRTGTHLTILGFGAMELRGQPRGPAVTDDDAGKVLNAVLDDLLDGMSRLEFMLPFTLSHPDLSTTIVGTANIDHLRSNRAVAEKGPLPDAVYAEATQRPAAAER